MEIKWINIMDEIKILRRAVRNDVYNKASWSVGYSAWFGPLVDLQQAIDRVITQMKNIND
jgi:hypothetical protein